MPVLVLAKADLCENTDEKLRAVEAATMGVEILVTSAIKLENRRLSTVCLVIDTPGMRELGMWGWNGRDRAVRK